MLDARSWRLATSQHQKLEALTKCPGQVDFYDAGLSPQDLAAEGHWQRNSPFWASLRSGFSKSPSSCRGEGEDKVFHGQVMTALGISPSWPGRTTYTVEGAQFEPGQKEPQASHLAESLALQMRAFPGATQVVVVSGHYDPKQQRLADIPLSQIGEAIDQGPVGLFVSDGCFLSGVESLEQLPESTRAAVVPQRQGRFIARLFQRGDQLRAEADNGLVLEPLVESEAKTALELAKDLVKRGTGNDRAGLTAVDLESLRSELTPALARLSESLRRGDRSLLKKLDQVHSEARSYDLGAVLALFQEHGSPQAQETAVQAGEALKRTVLTNTTSRDFPDDSGVTITHARLTKG